MLINKIFFLDECRDSSLCRLLGLPNLWDGSRIVWVRRAWGRAEKRKSFGTPQNCRQPQNNKLDILKSEGFFFSVFACFSLQSGTSNRSGIYSDHVSWTLLQLGVLGLNPFTDVQRGCQKGSGFLLDQVVHQDGQHVTCFVCSHD